MKKLILSAILLTCFTLNAFAQEDAGKNEITIWGGYSPDSTTIIRGTGRTPDARFGIVAVRYARRFDNGNKVNLKYTADVVPLAALSYPDVRILPTVPISAQRYRPTRYGFGAAPLGIQANFRPRKKLQPFVAASGGFLYFNKQTPNFIGTRFAYTADVGGGIEYRFSNKRAFTFGYKYYHISNGNRGIENPGFDNNLFYIGYTFLR